MGLHFKILYACVKCGHMKLISELVRTFWVLLNAVQTVRGELYGLLSIVLTISTFVLWTVEMAVC